MNEITNLNSLPIADSPVLYLLTILAHILSGFEVQLLSRWMLHKGNEVDDLLFVIENDW